MKHIIILGDGMADWHNEALGGATLLQHAHTPNSDKLARMGRNGLLKTVADGFHPGSEVANSSILGYDQHIVYQGRGPLEAAAIGVRLEDGDFALRCNLVSLDGDIIRNHSCGRLETEDADILIKYLDKELGNGRVHFHTGVQYRHLLVIKGGDKRIDFTPPHDIPLNVKREENGQDPANSIWPWGGGYKPQMQTLAEQYPDEIHRGAVITAVDLIRGIGRCAGLRVIEVPGATGLWDTNFRGKADAAIEALKGGDDFVYVHVEASDEAGHDGDLELKLRCIENLDRHVVGPILEYAEKCAACGEPVSVALLPDHPTPVEYRTHTAEPVPFAIWYPGIEADEVQTFDEDAAKAGAYGLLEGDGFIRAFMNTKQKNEFRNEIL